MTSNKRIKLLKHLRKNREIQVKTLFEKGFSLNDCKEIFLEGLITTVKENRYNPYGEVIFTDQTALVITDAGVDFLEKIDTDLYRNWHLPRFNTLISVLALVISFIALYRTF